MRLSRTTVLGAVAAVCGGFAGVSHGQNIAIQTELVLGPVDSPIGVYAPPGDTSRIFILRQTGEVLLYSLVTNSLVGTYLDLGPNGLNLTVKDNERGLLGMAFDPNFATNGRFYLNYTSRTNGATIIRRYTANAPFATSTSANTSSGLTLLTVAQDFSNHNGGSIHFGPDGMLYIFMGDGGSANDPNNRAQNDNSMLGKILRLDVNDNSDTDGDGFYIPNNNPFRALGDPRDKIWAKGLRNPWRSTFDRLTGDIWMADVGQDSREEVNFQPALVLQDPNNGNSTILNPAQTVSLNYGWDCREGLIAAPSNPAGHGCDASATGVYTNPILDYGRSGGQCSVTGGYVYRGSAIPNLQGAYFYTDYCNNAFTRILRYENGQITQHVQIHDQLRFNNSNLVNVVSFGEDAAGELYICSTPSSNPANGNVYRIVPFPLPCGCPCVATGPQQELFFDSFQTDQGWTVSSSGALSDGAWERVQVLRNVVNWQYAPPGDFDGNGWAFVTANRDNNSDVDGGTTILTSPQLDFSAGQITICYSYFLEMTNPSAGDGLFVDVSSNGAAGPWITVVSHTTDNSTRWHPHAISQAQLTAAGVTNTNNMRVRFRAADIDPGNIVEAGLDVFRILTANVPPPCACDWDGNSELQVADIFAFLGDWFADVPAAQNFGGTPGVPAIFAFLACWFAGCP